jgi:S1-C subfamily serine protease
MEFTSFYEQVFFSMLRIEFPKDKSVGTGFLVKVPSVIRNKEYTLLISNRHVVNDPNEKIVVNLHTYDVGNGFDLTKNECVAINKIETDSLCVDSNPNVDLSCLDLSFLLESKKLKVFVKPLTLDMFSDFTDTDLLAGKEIKFIGYPEGCRDYLNNLPILRDGIIASIPKVDFEGNPQFLIDAQIYSGSSGSPVFANLAGTNKLIGVLGQTIIKGHDLSEHSIGIGVVYKSTVTINLIKRAVEMLKKNSYSRT